MIETSAITDPVAAAAFANPRQRKILLTLIPKERSLSQLAGLTDMPLNLLHHHMCKFLRLGLVQIARIQARAGAPVKFYRATARAFFVPAELAPPNSRDSMSVRLQASLDRSRARIVKGFVYSHDGTGPRMRMVRREGYRTTAAEFWLELRLSQTDAAVLADEFKALFKRFEERSGGSGRRFIVHVAFALA